MKKVCLLFLFVMAVTISFGQAFTAVNWINWAEEPAYTDTIGYAEYPYDDREEASIPLKNLTVMDAGTFDAAWDQLPEAYNIAKPGNVDGGDLFDLGSGNTFGGQWKAFHDGYVVYFLLKFIDTDNHVDDGTFVYEVMIQLAGYNETEGFFRHEPTFEKGVADNDMKVKNMAYARYVALGGGKTVFKNGEVTSHDCSIGIGGDWGRNVHGFNAYDNVKDLMFWEKTGGVIRALLPMDFETEDGVLSYPVDEYLPDGDRAALQIGDIFSFDIMTNAKVGGKTVAYNWSGNRGVVWASTYYAGHAVLEPAATSIPTIDALQEGICFANNIVYVKEKSADLEVFSLTGTKVLSKANASALSLENLSNGFYIVRVNGKASLKVVKR
jgi:hypothetical protein